MAVSYALEVEQRLWGALAQDREYLYDQYEQVPYDPATGESLGELERDMARLLTERAAEPHVLLKARAMRLLLTRAQIYVDPRDWFPDKLQHGGLLHTLRRDWFRAERVGALGEHAAWFETARGAGVALGSLDTGHISPGWEKLFSTGLGGLAAEARWRRVECEAGGAGSDASTPDGAAPGDFYRAVEIVCEAAIALSRRFAEGAEALVDHHPAYRERLQLIAECCRHTPEHPPRTLHEALYFHWLMHELIELEGEAVRSLGRFDQLFAPYYYADRDAGRLSREQAMELFQYYWIKSTARTRGVENGAHFCLGGQQCDGADATNEMTALILDAREALDAADPKFSVRYHAGSPDWLYRRVLEMIRRGHCSMVLINDEAVAPALQKRGKTLEDARRYIPIGCYEPAVDGREAACTTNLVINLAKAVELALHGGVDPLSGQQLGPHTGEPRELVSFEHLLGAYWRQLDHMIERSAQAVAAHERAWAAINPSPLIACTLSDCLSRGRDVGQGGCRYNSVGCVGAGLANAADALAALRFAVYEQGRYRLEEIIEALRGDFQGREAMRQYLLHRAPKWGNGDPVVDGLALQVAEHYCDKIHTFRNERGGPYQAALYSFTFQWTLGRQTGATPDGRRAREPLAPGVGAMAGRDRAGITALLRSVSQIDFTETPNGSVLDLRLHPRSVAGEDGLGAMTSLVKTFFAQRGFALQFNIVDAQTLRAAQQNPEAYGSLQVRVAGYSAYFVRLAKEMQDHLIAQQTHSL